MPVAAGTALPLESGIEVTLGAGRLSAGDWWTIPALTIAVEWPTDLATGAPDPGLFHRQCRCRSARHAALKAGCPTP